MVKWLRLATPCTQADLPVPITCRLPFVSEPHGTHKMLLETYPRYEWATINVGQLLHICIQKSKMAATNECGFSKQS